MRALAAGRVVTCNPAREGLLGAVDDGAVVVEGERVAYVGPRSGLPGGVITELGDRVITPGLIDAHTHACSIGSRHDEYAARMTGADYRDVGSAGGGVLATHRAVAAASDEELAAALAARLRRMACLGVTTVEVKSGYGLEASLEKKQLRAIARVAQQRDVPAVVPTLLALHALPASARADRAAYVRQVATELVPESPPRRSRASSTRTSTSTPSRWTRRAACASPPAHIGSGSGFTSASSQTSAGPSSRPEGASSADHLEHVSAEGIPPWPARASPPCCCPSRAYARAARPPRDRPTRGRRPARRRERLEPSGPRPPRACPSPWPWRCARTGCPRRRRCSARRGSPRPRFSWRIGACCGTAPGPIWSCGTCPTSGPSCSRGGLPGRTWSCGTVAPSEGIHGTAWT